MGNTMTHRILESVSHADPLVCLDPAELRKEVAKAFGVAPEPSFDQLRAALIDGGKVVADLQTRGALSEADAQVLLAALSTMFITALVSRASQRFVDSSRSAPLRRWLAQASRGGRSVRP